MLAALAVLGAAGLGVFGLPSIDLHGPLHYLGVMDPLCGGTRSVRYAALGRWGLAWRYNPLGLLVPAAAVLTVAHAVAARLTGHRVGLRLRWTRRDSGWRSPSPWSRWSRWTFGSS